jgi:polysaccharide deacetylase 2 family uncharacterized protein YibQ
MLRLTQAQVRFWLIKGLHLFAVILIAVIACFHFGLFENPEPQPTATQKTSSESGDLSDPSAYARFCKDNEDLGCAEYKKADTKLIATHDDLTPAPESVEDIIFAKTQEHNVLTDQLLEMVTVEDTEAASSQESAAVLDKLYEEELPDDVIEHTPNTTGETTDNTVQTAPEADTAAPADNRPKIVIVIDDMGISIQRTADIISLEYPITTAFLTYGRNLDKQVDAARAKGHEIMLHTPMEPFSAANVAPDVLTTKMSPDEIKQNLRIMLAKFHNIKGINNHMGSKLTEDHERMQAVMDVLKEQNLFFLDSKTSAKSCAEQTAKENGLHYAHRHIFLDNTNEKNYVLEQLKRTENIAAKNGYAIAIGHPKTGTYAALKEWLPQLENKGFHLISMSDLMHTLYPQKP